MGASNRTLLSKLGFADADRKNSRHDRACNYLVLKQGALCATIESSLPQGVRVTSASGVPEFHVLKGEGKYATTVGFVDVLATFDVARSVGIRRPVEPPDRDTVYMYQRFLNRLSADPVWGKFPRKAGDAVVPNGMYQRYCDWRRLVTEELETEIAEEERAKVSAYRARIQSASRDLTVDVTGSFQAIIEVKIAKVSSGDLIRQMRVYREFTPLQASAKAPTRPQLWEQAYGEERECWARFELQEPRRLREDCYGRAIAVVDFDVDDEYRQACGAAGVHIVRLGRGFEEFLASAPPTAPSGPITEI